MALAFIRSWVPADNADTPSTEYAAETPGTPAGTTQASATKQPPAVGPHG